MTTPPPRQSDSRPCEDLQLPAELLIANLTVTLLPKACFSGLDRIKESIQGPKCLVSFRPDQRLGFQNSYPSAFLSRSCWRKESIEKACQFPDRRERSSKRGPPCYHFRPLSPGGALGLCARRPALGHRSRFVGAGGDQSPATGGFSKGVLTTVAFSSSHLAISGCGEKMR